MPGQISKLGQSLNYLSARRPIKTTAGDCEIRGGEYVSYDRANYATALKTWLPKAKNGEPEAQTYVGEIYEKGLGVVPDYRLASKWYRKVADQGYSRAQINLVYLYEAGLNGERDLVTAMNWYRKASGLEDDEIGFASTIETSVRAEFEEQIAVLNSELARSKNELKAQKENLKRSQKALDQRRKKLNRVRRELKETRKQLEVEKSTSDGGAESLELEKNTEDNRLREARLSATRQQVAKLESALKTQSLNFNAKLKKAEQRTSLLNQEIACYQKENSQFQDQLEQTRSQPSSFEEPKQQKVPASRSKGIPEIDFGTDHALIIGNQDYKYIQPLNTPVSDANAVAKILRDNYGFKTNVLINGDRYAILSALNELRGRLTEKDNLLIYYAGHGEYDKVNLRGHWLPVDAEQTSSANWISTVAITDGLNAMSAMHVLVIADSCYSGALTRASVARIQAGMSQEKKYGG